jgi:hypothetical protein
MEGPGTCQGEDGSFLPLVLESLANADRGTLPEIAGRLRREGLPDGGIRAWLDTPSIRRTRPNYSCRNASIGSMYAAGSFRCHLLRISASVNRAAASKL